MKKQLAAAFVASAMFTPATALADWHRGYVVEWYELASYWEAAEDENCPSGDNPEPDWKVIWNTDWRSAEELARLDEAGAVSFGFPLANRGPNPGMNVHRDPTLRAGNPNERNHEVVGTQSPGFDLDGNPATGGFTNADGSRTGIDNQLYRAVGCFKDYRGRPHETGATTAADAQYYNNDEMRNGNYTVLIVLSGEGDDPMNDPTARVGIYQAKERLFKMANNEISPDVSYRIDPDPRFMSVFDAVSEDGVFRPREPLERLNVRDHGSRPYHPFDLELINPQIELSMQEDGRLEVLMGGYRNWKQYYWGWAAAGNTTENARQITLVGLWNSLEANADGVPDPVTGEMTHISANFHMEAVPAFIVTPDTNAVVAEAVMFDGMPLEVGPERDPLPLASKIGSLGGNASFYLDGGAAAWPREPRDDILQAGRPVEEAVAAASND